MKNCLVTSLFYAPADRCGIVCDRHDWGVAQVRWEEQWPMYFTFVPRTNSTGSLCFIPGTVAANEWVTPTTLPCRHPTRCLGALLVFRPKHISSGRQTMYSHCRSSLLYMTFKRTKLSPCPFRHLVAVHQCYHDRSPEGRKARRKRRTSQTTRLSSGIITLMSFVNATFALRRTSGIAYTGCPTRGPALPGGCSKEWIGMGCG